MTRVKRDKMALVYKLIQQWLFVGEISRLVFVRVLFSQPSSPPPVPSLEEYARIRRVERSLSVDVPRLEIDPET